LQAEHPEVGRSHFARHFLVSLEQRLLGARGWQVVHSHAPSERDQPGRTFLDQRGSRAVRDAQALLEPAEKTPPFAQRIGVGWVEIAVRLESGQSSLGLRGPNATVSPVPHLQPLNRELDVDEATAPDLQVVARGWALVAELPLHS